MIATLAFHAAVMVSSAVAAAAPIADDIRDIRGPVEIPEPTSWWPYALAIVGALLAGFVIREVVRRRRKPRTPEALALEELAAARGQAESGDAHLFAIAVSNAIRGYLERAFGIHAPTRTTEELLRGLMTETSPVAAHRTELGAFLEHCDLAKYARSSLTAEQMTAMLESARTFVRTAGAARTDRPHATSRAPVAVEVSS